MSKDKNSGLLSLKKDILTKIFSVLGPNDVVQLGATCKYLNQLSQSSLIWKDYLKKNFPREFSDFSYIEQNTLKNTNEINISLKLKREYKFFKLPSVHSQNFWYRLSKELYHANKEDKLISALFHLLNNRDFNGFKNFLNEYKIKIVMDRLIHGVYNNELIICLFKSANLSPEFTNLILQEYKKNQKDFNYSIDKQLFFAIAMNFPTNEIISLLDHHSCSLDILLAKEHDNSHLLYSPMHAAVFMKRVDVIVLLYKKLDNLKKPRSLLSALKIGGMAPLHIAANENLSGIAFILIQNGAVIDSKITKKDHLLFGFTPLHIAVSRGFIETYEVLKKNKANLLKIVTCEGEPVIPLSLAFTSGQINIISSLFELTLDKLSSQGPVKIEKKKLVNAFMVNYISKTYCVNLDVIKFLHTQGAVFDTNDIITEEYEKEDIDANGKKELGYKKLSLLGCLLSNTNLDNLRVANYICKYNACFLSHEKPKIYTLYQAIENNLNYLVKSFIDFDKSLLKAVFFEDNYTPLIYACLQQNYDIVSYLISKGANVNHQDKKGKNVLILLIENMQTNYLREEKKIIFDILIRNGASLDLQDKKGKTALNYIQDSEYPILQDYFSEKKIEFTL